MLSASLDQTRILFGWAAESRTSTNSTVGQSSPADVLVASVLTLVSWQASQLSPIEAASFLSLMRFCVYTQLLSATA